MSVMSGACVSRARLQATDGAPMPTKHTSLFFSTRRGEGGGAARGGPLWSPAVPACTPDCVISPGDLVDAGDHKGHSAHHPPDGVPIHSPLAPTDHIASCLSPWLLHIFGRCLLSSKNVLPHPAEKRLALPRDPIPRGVEGVIAPVIAVGIGWVRASRRLDDSIDRPMRQHRGVRTRNAQVVDDLLYGHYHVGRRERGLFLHPDNPFDEHIPRAVRSLRVNDREIRSDGGNGGKPFTAEGTFDKPDTRVDPHQVRTLIPPEDCAGQTCCTGRVGIGHRRVAVLLQLQWLRPPVLNRVAQSVQHPYARIAAPGEDKLARTSHANELVIE